jgi:hypothetical protein
LPLAAADVTQHVRGDGQRHPAIDVERFRTVILGAVQDETGSRLDRPADKHVHAVGDAAGIGAERRQQAGDRALLGHPIDDDAERAAPAVPGQQNDGVIEGRLAQVGRGNQELAGERRAAGNLRLRG